MGTLSNFLSLWWLAGSSPCLRPAQAACHFMKRTWALVGAHRLVGCAHVAGAATSSPDSSIQARQLRVARLESPSWPDLRVLVEGFVGLVLVGMMANKTSRDEFFTNCFTSKLQTYCFCLLYKPKATPWL